MSLIRLTFAELRFALWPVPLFALAALTLLYVAIRVLVLLPVVG